VGKTTITNGSPTESITGAGYGVVAFGATTLVELQAAINRCLAEHNRDPRPFRWTKSPKKIIAAVKRRFQVLEARQGG
jgi:hypothetical protein